METCDLCSNGKFQRAYGQTACEACVPGFYCKTGAAEPVPCPAGYVGNATGLFSAGQCTPVPIGFWAPLGSSIPEQCPASGFYCPGALRDDVHGGAKPVLVPVGQSTRTVSASALSKAMTLDLSLDDFAAQREQLKIQLAAQYGVDPSLISLEAAAARRRARVLQSSGLVLTITIATEDNSGSFVDLATVEQAFAAIDDTALATTISSVTGTSVTVVSQPVQTTNVLVEQRMSCPKGKWCTARLIVDCPLGTYNPLEDQDFATACIMCPPNSYTRETNSTSRAQCVCGEGFYDSNASTAIDTDLIAAMIAAGPSAAYPEPVSMVADVVTCEACPVGTNCARGSTLEALPLLTGYYRLDATTVDVRECPDARKNCSTSFGTAACESSSGCSGGATGCAPGLAGPYCELCNRTAGLVYYTSATVEGVATCAPCEDKLSSTFVFVVVVVGLIGLAALVVYLVRRNMSDKTVMRLKILNGSFTPRNKFKIVMTFYQLATKVPTVYSVLLPPDVNVFLESLSSFFSFGFDSPALSSTPLECMSLHGYTYKLIAYMALPPVLVLIVVLVVTCTSRRSTKVVTSEVHTKKEADHGSGFHLEPSDGPQRDPTFFEKTLPAVLTLIFVLYPMVTKVAFDGFPCYYFEDGAKGYLRQDVSLQCHAPDARPMPLVWLAVILCK